MAVRLVVLGLLATSFLGNLASAQYFKPVETQDPKKPQTPQTVPSQVYRPSQQVPVVSKPQTPRDPQKPQTTHQQNTQQQKKPQTQTTWNPDFTSCEVAAPYKIQCGLAGIGAAECSAINCCFDGQTCYYGKAVTLQCTKDAQFIVVVARDATLPNIDLDSINFMGTDQNCQAVGMTTAFAVYQFPVTSCGTTVMEDESGVLIYENRMSSSYEVAIGPHGAITRDSQFDLMIQCRYIGTTVQALVVEVWPLPGPPPVAAPGPLNVELRLGNGQCTMKGCNEEDVAYNSYYLDSDYPVTKVLRDPVYVEVRLLDRTDPNLVLTLGRCWATSSPYSQSLPQWDLLIDGCPYRDDRYQTYLVHVVASSGVSYPTHYRRFFFKMFTFVAADPSNPTKQNLQHDGVLTPLREKVYVHCNTAVCKPTPGDNCEPRCFRKKRDIAASVKSGSRPETVTVTSQVIIIVDQSQAL
ncbi:zona pellucida sperm-binding protein 4-like [Eucyclogobius newberryi]|uniref:zona pellucida sperm-binding protein 4-like n=1 Tax=Eucyclogobius newberryi TaxID=166745 RepID=UPI003B59C58F